MSRDEDIFEELFAVIESRRDEQPSGSYTASLLTEGGEDDVVEKVGEEAIELMLAANNGDDDRIVEECADVFYHAMVLLAAHDIAFDDVRAALRRRRD